MSNQDIKPRLAARPKASLIAAAAASASSSAQDVKPVIPTPIIPTARPAPAINSNTAGGVSMSASASTISEGSSRSTPVPVGSGTTGETVAKMKFRPKASAVKRVKQEVEVKAEPSTRGRGAPRARGRGGATRGRPVVATSIAAGPLGGPRAVTNGRRLAPPPAPPRVANDSIEIYSDHEGEDGQSGSRIIDIDAVSGLGESAPTSLARDRELGNTKGKLGKAKAKEERSKRRHAREEASTVVTQDMDVDPSSSTGNEAGPSEYRVKDEPISPEKLSQHLPDEDPNQGVPPPRGSRGIPEREDDSYLPEDVDQDLDHQGARVRGFMQTGGVKEEEEDVNEAQMVDLSESEEEEEEEEMEGDFVQVPGMDNPEDKLFIFQFPTLFPKFIPNTPIDATEDTKEGVLQQADGTETSGPKAGEKSNDSRPGPEKDVKPNVAALRGRKKVIPPEGQIGRLFVMKSGRVKMALGDGIVMDVTPGVPATFLQQLVHLDPSSKSSIVLGEIHKQYLVTPDIDRLLNELYLNGGKTPGDKELEERRKTRNVKMERDLVKMEID